MNNLETMLHICIGLYALMCLCMAGYLWLAWPKRSMDKLHRGEIGLAQNAALKNLKSTK